MSSSKTQNQTPSPGNGPTGGKRERTRLRALAGAGLAALRSVMGNGPTGSPEGPDGTKVYGYSIQVASNGAGIVQGQERFLRLMLHRIRLVEGHRIEIVAPAGPNAEADLASVRGVLLAADVAPERIHRSVRADDGSVRVEVQLLPRVASLADRPDEAPLDIEEVRTIGRARRALQFGCETELLALESESDSIDWPRLCGHRTLKEWASAGGRHPLYDAERDPRATG